MLRAWTTTLCLASTLLFACGGDDDGGGDTGDSADNDAAAGGDDGGGGGDGDAGTDNADAAGGDFTGITCADDTCEAGAEVCCLGDMGLTCAAECAGTSFACDGPEDCEGENICCGSRDGTLCTAAGDCGGGGEGDAVCHVAEDCPEAGQECCTTPQGNIGVCRNRCPGA